MAYDPLPIQYRKSPPYTISVDFFDFASGAGYKKFYLAGLATTTGNKEYILTTDSGLQGDSDNMVIGAGSDLDFDITFNNPVIIAAADATFSYMQYMSNDNSCYFNVTITVRHVRNGVETDLGTVTSDSDDGDPTIYRQKSCRAALTRQVFAKGDILRINLTIASNYPVDSSATYIDPSGGYSQSKAGGGTTSSAFIANIPFEVEQ